MNESNPEITPLESPESAAPAFKDRSTGLMVFGILTILLGCLAGLFSLVMLLPLAVANASPTTVNTATILPGMAIYGVLAVALIWLGIGSIKARRWARALLLIFSWSWLGIGIITTVGMAFVMPKILANLPANPANGQPAMPPAAITGMIVFMVLFFGAFFVVTPAVWTFFYMSRHVKSTCEARDPVTSWTDACPLPVLGVCLWLALGVPMFLIMSVVGLGVLPFFGMFLTGLPGALFCLALAALWSYAAWRLYRMDVRGWWLLLIALVVFTVSGLMTYARHDMIEVYQLMRFPQAQIDQMQKTGLMTSHAMIWFQIVFMVPVLGYLLFIKKYFQAKA